MCCAGITTCAVRSSLLDTPRCGIASAQRVRVMADKDTAIAVGKADDANKTIAADMGSAGEPCCSLCGDKVDPLKKGVRLRAKQPKTWCCHKCNAVNSKQHHWLGTWPINEFKDLPDDAVRKFYKAAHGAKVPKMKHLTMDALKKIYTEREQDTLFSESLPLNVWVSRGFTEDQVKAFQSTPHEKFGTVYAVEVHQVSKSKVVEEVRERIRNLTQTKSQKRSKPMPASDDHPHTLAHMSGTCDNVANEFADGDDAPEHNSDGGSSSSSSSSSTSSDGATTKKKKKNRTKPKAKQDARAAKAKLADAAKQERLEKAAAAKATAKQQRELAQQELKQKQDTKKRHKTTHEFATKIIAKVSPLVPQMEAVAQHPDVDKAPQWVLQRFTDVRLKAIAAKTEAEHAMKVKEPHQLSCDQTAVTELVKECVAILKVMLPILDAVK